MKVNPIPYSRSVIIDNIGKFDINDWNNDFEILHVENNAMKVKFQGMHKVAIIKKYDFIQKKLHINIDGFNFIVTVIDPIDHLIDQLGFLKSNTSSVKEIKAPMPGLVLNIHVSVGQVVNEGDKLITLEAMKMENLIKSPRNGVISNIHVNLNIAVNKNQLLISFE